MTICLVLVTSISTLSGAWVLNKELSTPTTAFSAPPPADRARRPPHRGGWGGRIGSWGSGEPIRRGDDQEKLRTQRAATAELLQPSARLTITHTSTDVTLVDADGRARKYRTPGEKQKNQLLSSTVETRTKWKDGKLTQEFAVGNGAKVTLEYAVDPESDQLVVVARPDDSGGSAALVRWVYDRVR